MERPITPTPPTAIDRRRDRLQEMYREEAARMVRFAAATLGDAELARDVVNDTFVIALTRLIDLRRDDSLKAWIWTILLNESRKAKRRRRREPPAMEWTDQPAASVPVLVDHDLRRLLRRVPRRQRTALFLKYFGDLPNTAIAEAMGISPATVAATLSQANRSVRRLIEEERDGAPRS